MRQKRLAFSLVAALLLVLVFWAALVDIPESSPDRPTDAPDAPDEGGTKRGETGEVAWRKGPVEGPEVSVDPPSRPRLEQAEENSTETGTGAVAVRRTDEGAGGPATEGPNAKRPALLRLPYEVTKKIAANRSGGAGHSAISLTRDGSLLGVVSVVSHEGRGIWLLDTRTGTVTKSIKRTTGVFYDLSFSREEQELLFVTSKEVIPRDINDLRIQSRSSLRLPDEVSWLLRVSLSPAAMYILGEGSSHRLRALPEEAGRRYIALPKGRAGCLAAASGAEKAAVLEIIPGDPAGDAVASVSFLSGKENKVRWRRSCPRPQATRRSVHDVGLVDTTADGGIVAVGWEKGEVHLFKGKDGSISRTLVEPDCSVCDFVRFAKDGEHLYSGHRNGMLLRWEIDGGAAPRLLFDFSEELEKREFVFQQLEVSDDERIVAVLLDDGQLRILTLKDSDDE